MIELQGITKSFGSLQVLKGIDLTIDKGEVVSIVGPSGAGKTTLIRIINRITAPDAGEVWFDGRLSRPEDIYSIGYLPEERGLYKKMKSVNWLLSATGKSVLSFSFTSCFRNLLLWKM